MGWFPFLCAREAYQLYTWSCLTLLRFLSCNAEVLMFERLPGVCSKFRRLLLEQPHCHNQYLASYISEEFPFSYPKITVDEISLLITQQGHLQLQDICSVSNSGKKQIPHNLRLSESPSPISRGWYLFHHHNQLKINLRRLPHLHHLHRFRPRVRTLRWHSVK